jgi:hypothetical protein
MCAYATVHKFREVMKVSVDPDLPADKTDVINKTTDAGKRQAAARWRNDTAVANFTMAFQGEELLQIILDAVTDEWP